MLIVKTRGYESYDEKTEIITTIDPVVVKLEHSLISLSKWESKWKKPYLPSRLHRGMHTRSEQISYISCMLVGRYGPAIPMLLYRNHSTEIAEYISDPHSATTIHRTGQQKSARHTVTAELIYFWMIHYHIPFACERWHLNRLMTLIDVCNVKEQESSQKGNKMSAGEAAIRRAKLNRDRRVGL